MALRHLSKIVTLTLDPKKCGGCGLCLQVCPHAVFVMGDKKAGIRDRNACMECGACARNCPSGAIRVNAGVGCAAAEIIGRIKGTEPQCGCGEGGCC